MGANDDQRATAPVPTATPQAEGDAMPAEPRRPEPDECCHSGCAFCVQDMYEDAMDRYRAALKDWQARQGQRQ